jgi:beta-glucosidase
MDYKIMINRRKLFTLAAGIAALFCFNMTITAQIPTSVKNIPQRVETLLKQMTLEEKIGQMHQLNRDLATGTVSAEQQNMEEVVRKGGIGSFLTIFEMDEKIKFQTIAVKESRLKIPLIFGLDVIHGYRTIFPIPLAEAASFDLAAIENAERIAATEARADGVHWTFAPMMDVGRDPRWGRVMEGAGEDTYLGSLIAAARVRGFQGKDLSADNTLVACAKHFAAYGFGEAGREYNTVNMSEQRLREVVLPPFKAAIDAGVGTVMNAFHTLNGVPASADKHLGIDILKKEWGFKGFVISDWASYNELIYHGVAANQTEAAALALNAGGDMDMEGRVYINALKKALAEKRVTMAQIDEAVRRILTIKMSLGLFDDPFRYLNKERRDNTMWKPEFIEASRDMARKGMVLLRNENQTLPFSKKVKTIAIVGPFADAKGQKDYLSFWTFRAVQSKVITLAEGVKNKIPGAEILIAAGVDTSNRMTEASLNDALQKVQRADIVIVALGEHGINSGEARSFTNLNLPGEQEALLKKVVAAGKPTALVLINGRPLTIEWAAANCPAILEAWQPGQEAGNAIADVLFGDYNPAGKLPLTFPVNVGQIPIYYNELSTGRPWSGKQEDFWFSRYRDVGTKPLYPFGYGLSYTRFEYSDISLDKTAITANEKLQASVTLNNAGNYDGEEIVQLYIRDLVADISRPVKELKGFQKVFLAKGSSKKITFSIGVDELKYWNNQLKYKADKGEFEVMIGTSSEQVKIAKFSLK